MRRETYCPISESQSRRKLQSARAACAEDRVDPSGGLAEVETWIGWRRVRYRWPRHPVQRAAVPGQVGDVESVETFSNQQQPQPLGQPDGARDTEIVSQIAVGVRELAG